jgi:hypothetical protein
MGLCAAPAKQIKAASVVHPGFASSTSVGCINCAFGTLVHGLTHLVAPLVTPWCMAITPCTHSFSLVHTAAVNATVKAPLSQTQSQVSTLHVAMLTSASMIESNSNKHLN